MRISGHDTIRLTVRYDTSKRCVWERHMIKHLRWKWQNEYRHYLDCCKMNTPSWKYVAFHLQQDILKLNNATYNRWHFLLFKAFLGLLCYKKSGFSNFIKKQELFKLYFILVLWPISPLIYVGIRDLAGNYILVYAGIRDWVENSILVYVGIRNEIKTTW